MSRLFIDIRNLRSVTIEELKRELSLQKKSGLKVKDFDKNINIGERDQLARELSKISNEKTFEPKTDVIKDIIDGIPPVFAILSNIRITSSILTFLNQIELKDELINQEVVMRKKNDTLPQKSELIRLLMDRFADEKKDIILPYKEPLQTLIRNLTCPSLFGVDITVRDDNETTILSLTKGDVMEMSEKTIQKELRNQGLSFEDQEEKISLVERLINYLRNNPTQYNNNFSKEFEAYLKARKTLIQEDATLQYLQAVQNKPSLLIPPVIINLDDEDLSQNTSSSKSLLDLPRSEPVIKEAGGITGVNPLKNNFSLNPASI